jgi:hypothetical protein
MKSTCLCLLPMLVGLGTSPVLSQDFGSLSFASVTEIRGGINVTGVELWTAFQPYSGLEQYRSLDTAEIELLFTPPNAAFLQYLGSPQIEFGAHISTIGRASLAHLGLNWRTQLFDTPVFIDGVFGVAVTNSKLANTTPPERDVGCPGLLYFGADLGYQIDQHWSIMGSIYHASHASLCNLFIPDAKNDGLNGFGVKVGYKF